MTTGIDIPKIANLVSLRRARSRILYEQMIGRATRRCDDIGKERFRIFDAVDLYSALQKVTDMKPVVVNPQVTLRTAGPRNRRSQRRRLPPQAGVFPDFVRQFAEQGFEGAAEDFVEAGEAAVGGVGRRARRRAKAAPPIALPFHRRSSSWRWHAA